MTTATKKKLCWNCEGRVGFSEEHCPFCGVYLSPTPISGHVEDDSDDQAPEPPYGLDEESKSSSYHDPLHQDRIQRPGSKKQEAISGDEFRKMITPLGTLLAGSIFFLFGLVLFLFSKDGKLTLQWNSDYWYVYSAFSLVLLFWGWKSLQYIDD